MMGYKGWRIPEGNVVEVKDASGIVLWAVKSEEPTGPIILEVEKITSDTYAGETTYTAEEFILLDIYPKTNGTVNVTYGGLTKTITDTSGAEEPNAQQVFFGTFNGVSDSVATPTSGELTIEGDCEAIAIGTFANSSKSSTNYCNCVNVVASTGSITYIPNNAFFGCTKLSSVIISNGVKTIMASSFSGCTGLTDVTIPKSVNDIGLRITDLTDMGGTIMYSWVNPWRGVNKNNPLSINKNNPHYKIDGNCLIEIGSNKLVSGFLNSIIPSYITELGGYCFAELDSLVNVSIPNNVVIIGDGAFYNSGLTSLTIPESVTEIGSSALNTNATLTIEMLSKNPPILVDSVTGNFGSNTTIVVPSGCGDSYKTAEVWSENADIIVEAS